jgi:hypothetical protein
LVAFGAAAADTTEARLREALRSATLQLRTLEDEKSAWQAKEAQLKKEGEALQAELAAAKKTAPSPQGRTNKERELAARLAEQSAARTSLAESLAQCQASAQKADEASRAATAESVARADAAGKRAASCEAKNAQLYRVGKEVLDWLSDAGPGTALLAREPLLGLKRVELENIAQEYQDKLLDQRVSP